MTMQGSPLKASDEKELMTELWSPLISESIYNYVMFAFPWGKQGTILEKEKGPRKWQEKKLRQIDQFIAEQKFRELNELLLEIFKDATVAGRGVGKSALVAWLILWMMSTKLGSTTIVTANTEPQLRTKTWPELGRWHTLAINRHWFDMQATSLIPTPWFKDLVEKELGISCAYYYAKALLWDEDNPDAFAGAHNPLGMMLIFDEASGIAANIWTVSIGFFTEKKCKWRFWFAFSNGRRNTGQFFECFHKDRIFWRNTNIDGRDVEDTDHQLYNEIIAKHGEDSDEARIEVKGQFPQLGENQFISREDIDGATLREATEDPFAPLMMGIDVARGGRDYTVFAFRRGRDARTIPAVKLKGKDNMQVANTAAEWIEKVKPDAVCIDSGAGTGVIDRLRELGYKVHEIFFSGKVDDGQWADKRTEIWGRMREWLPGAAIENDQMLKDDLAAPWKKWVGKASDQQRLCSKDEMKKEGFASPDYGDALALTFAVKVSRKDTATSRHGSSRRGDRSRQIRDTGYNPLG